MILLKNQQKVISLNQKRIKKAAEHILGYLGIADHELSILLLDNKGITDLNKKYLGRNRPTNVISFSLNEGEYGDLNPTILGDVVISVEKAHEQAEIKGTSLEGEIIFLLIHGILHLLGYDHEKKKAEQKKMENKEKEVLQFVNKIKK